MDYEDDQELADKQAGVDFDEDLQSAVAAELHDSIDYIDEEISPERAKATKYYRGDLFGNEIDGASQFVSTDVRDVVLGLMPNLMRIFAGAERLVEFTPTGPEDVEAAAQATDTVQYVFERQNKGFSILYSLFKDALVRKTGIVKWWAEEQVDVSEYQYDGLTEEQFAVLAQDPDIEIVKMEIDQEQDVDEEHQTVDPMMLQGAPQPAFYDVSVKRTKKSMKYRVESVPPEEFLISRTARDEDSASIVAHRQILTVSDLVLMGYEKDLCLEHTSADDDGLQYNEERYARDPRTTFETVTRNDPASRKVLYIQSWIRYDRDGDGIAELLKVCTMGNAYTIVSVEPADEIPFAIFTPDPEPHMAIGLSEADKVMDIQRAKSQIVRDMFDSLAQAIRPRIGVVEGQANMDDVLNNEMGAPIRMRQPGMVQPFAQPFVGQSAFPVLQYLDDTKESRTGVSKASMGLNADALQSSTSAAVSATITGAQGRVELVARVFAETGLKRLFKGILKMLITHQDAPMIIRLRNKFVSVDPRTWNTDMDVDVNVALSATSTNEKLAVLTQVSNDQKEVLMTLGVQNPLVNLAQFRNTKAKMLEMAGFKDPGQFYLDVDPNYQPPQPEQKPTPEEMLAQVQAQAIQADIAKKSAELELKREEMIRNDDRERDKIEADAILRAAEIRAKYGAQVDVAHIEAMMERDREAQRQRAALEQAAIAQATQEAQAAQQPQPMPEMPQPPMEGPMNAQ